MSPTVIASARQTRIILMGTALLLALGMGMRQSFGLFLTPVTHDLAVTTADFTFALAMQNIVWGLSQALVGAAADRFGLRRTFIVGVILQVLGLAIMAAAQGALALVVANAFIGISLSCTATSLAMTACARAVSEARSGRISEHYATPAAVTLSNLGMVGVDRFTAVVDPDQTAILAAGAVVDRPAAVADGIGLAPQLELVLTADHRAVDGMVAGRFLVDVRTRLEGAGTAPSAP